MHQNLNSSTCQLAITFQKLAPSSVFYDNTKDNLPDTYAFCDNTKLTSYLNSCFISLENVNFSISPPLSLLSFRSKARSVLASNPSLCGVSLSCTGRLHPHTIPKPRGVKGYLSHQFQAFTRLLTPHSTAVLLLLLIFLLDPLSACLSLFCNPAVQKFSTLTVPSISLMQELTRIDLHSFIPCTDTLWNSLPSSIFRLPTT